MNDKTARRMISSPGSYQQKPLNIGVPARNPANLRLERSFTFGSSPFRLSFVCKPPLYGL